MQATFYSDLHLSVSAVGFCFVLFVCFCFCFSVFGFWFCLFVFCLFVCLFVCLLLFFSFLIRFECDLRYLTPHLNLGNAPDNRA